MSYTVCDLKSFSSSCNLHQFLAGGGVNAWGPWLCQVLPWGDQRRPQLCQTVSREVAKIEASLTITGISNFYCPTIQYMYCETPLSRHPSVADIYYSSLHRESTDSLIMDTSENLTVFLFTSILKQPMNTWQPATLYDGHFWYVMSHLGGQWRVETGKGFPAKRKNLWAFLFQKLRSTYVFYFAMFRASAPWTDTARSDLKIVWTLPLSTWE